MDQHEFDFLLKHTRVQESRLRERISQGRAGRGSTFLELSVVHLDAARDACRDLEARFPHATVDLQRRTLERKAIRIKASLDDLHAWIVHFGDDVGRLDVPVGIRFLIDALIEAISTDAIDPIIHTDDAYMYSVISPVDEWESLFGVLGVTFANPTRPMAFNLPGSDPYNVLLSPILGHEVGHTVVNGRDLLDEFDQRIDHSLIQPIWDECKALGATDSQLQETFSSWVSELLCDAFAVAVTGPSLLFSALGFLPGPTAGYFGDSHPDPAHRLSLTLTQLQELGWEPLLTECASGVLTWSQSLAAAPPDPTIHPVLLRLSDAVPVAANTIWEIVKEVVGDGIFTPEDYELVRGSIAAHLDQGLPPVEVDGSPTSVWAIVLGVWLHAIRRSGGDFEGLPDVIADLDLNRFALKTIELACVLRTWRDDGPATP